MQISHVELGRARFSQSDTAPKRQVRFAYGEV